MKRAMQLAAVPVGILVVWILLMWLTPRLSQPVFGQAASKEGPHIGEGGVPQFQLDPSFPKVPAKWRMGFGSDSSVDEQNHVWILSRPRDWGMKPGTPVTWTTPAAPPVMEFDNDGNFIQGWGGESGPGYDWPSNEHAITVDSKGFVWIMGNADGTMNNPLHLQNDNQIIKFTKAGKFVMAIGKSGQTGSNKTEVLKGASGVKYYAKTNELFVSDGYGNSRIVVYDADTGKVKRMWGAYGHKPLDMEDRPPRSKMSLSPWLGVSEVLQQFGFPLHDVAISDDGLIYACDRGNKRVQVFTPDGKFIAEQFVGLDSKYGEQSRGAAFSPDQKFLYLAGTQVFWILNRKTLEVLGSVDIGGADLTHPVGHKITADHKGNIYVAGADQAGGGRGVYKYTFKGYSPATSCPPTCETTRNGQQ